MDDGQLDDYGKPVDNRPKDPFSGCLTIAAVIALTLAVTVLLRLALMD